MAMWHLADYTSKCVGVLMLDTDGQMKVFGPFDDKEQAELYMRETYLPWWVIDIEDIRTNESSETYVVGARMVPLAERKPSEAGETDPGGPSPSLANSLSVS